jgi:hypothetical protein
MRQKAKKEDIYTVDASILGLFRKAAKAIHIA